jgi:predicted SAM-dependent methyltransferase
MEATQPVAESRHSKTPAAQLPARRRQLSPPVDKGGLLGYPPGHFQKGTGPPTVDRPLWTGRSSGRVVHNGCPMSKSKEVIESYLAGPGPHKLELGAGHNGKHGWLPTDRSEFENSKGVYTVRVDVTKPFPFGDETFDYIFSEHMIEHLSLKDGQFMVNECKTVLKRKGVLRIVTPSLGFLLRVLSSDRSRFEENYVRWSVKVLVPDAPTVTNAVFFNNFVRAWGHLFIYDRQTLEFIMKEAGFSGIKECLIGKSEHSALTDVESIDRMPPGYHELESMIFEATK